MDNVKQRVKKVMPKSPGRPKGVPNKTTALLKDAILLAAQNAGGGGGDGLVNYLEARAKDTPGPFLALVGKVLPMQLAGADGKDLTITFHNIYEKGKGAN